ncbi:hypothetical protein FHS40_008781 [Streptomyces spectabilis]|uniref:Uncharacterized protein n=1 Tax=Streptomyces spectabilis TaxID=68270 RepID=A0A7W8B3H2_STRST|nr:hypothetical protein [Streptomyces spectabilis]
MTWSQQPPTRPPKRAPVFILRLRPGLDRRPGLLVTGTDRFRDLLARSRVRTLKGQSPACEGLAHPGPGEADPLQFEDQLTCLPRPASTSPRPGRHAIEDSLPDRRPAQPPQAPGAPRQAYPTAASPALPDCHPCHPNHQMPTASAAPRIPPPPTQPPPAATAPPALNTTDTTHLRQTTHTPPTIQNPNHQ